MQNVVTDVIEIKDFSRIIQGIGQLAFYEEYYPNHQKILWVFNTGEVTVNELNELQRVCDRNRIELVIHERLQGTRFSHVLSQINEQENDAQSDQKLESKSSIHPKCNEKLEVTKPKITFIDALLQKEVVISVKKLHIHFY